MITDKENGYICGWLDADGCFSIYKVKRRGARLGYDFTPSIKISNTDKKVVCWLRDKLGMSRLKIYERKFEYKKNIFMIDIAANRDLLRILLMLDLDSLITKKEQAQLLLRFVQRRVGRWEEYLASRGRDPKGRFTGGGLLVTEEEIMDYSLMKSLKGGERK